MNKISLYSSFPYWLQNVAVSLHGYKLKRQRFNDDFYKILDFLNSTQGWSKEQIRSYKEEHTFKILEQAYNHCPYYRKKYANVGLSPSDFKRLEDLRKFPILTKEEIRENWQGMVADNVSKEDLILYHTSGSTGKALDFYWTKHSSAYYWAVDQRYKNRFGFELGKTCVNFTGHPIVPITTSKPPYWRFDRVLNRYFLNMQQLNAHTIHTIAEWLNTKRMEIFIGYPSIMTAFANEMLQAGLTLEFLLSISSRVPRNFMRTKKIFYGKSIKGFFFMSYTVSLSKLLLLHIVRNQFIMRILRLGTWSLIWLCL